MEFDLDYRGFGKGHVVVAGRAKTVNISSAGILLRPTEGLSAGQFVELSIGWRLGSSGPASAKLEIIGRVSRVDNAGTVVRILRYGFCTPR